MECCDPGSGQSLGLKETALQLISRHQKLYQLLQEVSSQKLSDCGDNDFQQALAGSCFESVIRDKALLSRQPDGCYGAEQCATQLLCLVKGHSTQNLSEQIKASVHIVLHGIKQLISRGSFSRPRFESALSQEKQLPLELLWLLHTDGVLSLESHLSLEKEDASSVTNLASAISQLRKESDMDSICLKGILGLLADLVFSEKRNRKESESKRKSLITVLDGVFTDFINEVLEGWEQKSPSICIPLLPDIMVAMDMLKKVHTHLLNVVLSYKPVLKVSQAIQQQQQWTYGRIPGPLTAWFKQVLLVFESKEILDILNRILERQEINWQLLLSFISVFVVCMPESSRSFTEFTEQLLQVGLEESDAEKVITGLLLSHQACCHGPHVYYTYPDWFQRTFSESSRSPANSRKTFSVLMKFLTDLVPYETPQHLKVHITRPPYFPAKCRPLFKDYVSLAKTRLSDLQEDSEPFATGGDKESEKNKRQFQAEEEVEKCLAHFDTTGKIPSSIMETSIFRKPYYIGVFLPVLLKPRPLPDVPDTRMKLIEALRRSDKIPVSLYTNYEKACKKEAMQLLEGVFLVDDSDDDINNMELGPIEQLQQCLIQMTSLVKSQCNQSKSSAKYTVKELLCLVAEKLHESVNLATGRSNAERGNQTVNNGGPVVLDVEHSYVPLSHLQIADLLLNWIARTVHATYATTNPEFHWLKGLLSVMAQFPPLIKALYIRVWTLSVNQMPNLKQHHTEGLAAVLAECLLLGDQLPLLQLSVSCNHCNKLDPVTLLVMDSLPVHKSIWIEKCLRFLTCYISYCVSSCSQQDSSLCNVLTPAVAKKYMYLCTRMVPELRRNEGCGVLTHAYCIPNRALVVNLYSSSIFQTILKDNMLSFKEWLKLELTVVPEEDFFSPVERHDYHIWMIYSHFLVKSRGNHGSYDVRMVATEMLEELIDSDTRCQSAARSCDQCRGQGVTRNLALRSEMIGLLQGLVQLIRRPESQHNKSGQLPWLLTILKKLLSDRGDKPVQTQASVSAFFRLTLCLPAYLLFSNTSGQSDSAQDSLPDTAETLDHVLTEYVNTDIFIQQSLTMYLLQGLVTMAAASSRSSPSDILDVFCQSCSVFTVSLMVHWSQLQYLLQSEALNDSSTVRDFISARFWLDSLITSKTSSVEKGLCWPCCIVLFCHTLNNDISMATETVKHCCNLATKSSSVKQVLKVYSELLLFHTTYSQLTSCIEKMKFAGIFTVMHEAGIPVLTSLSEEHLDGKSHKCASKSVRKLANLVYTRLVCQTSVTAVLKGEDGLLRMLQLFSHVASDFETMRDDNSSLRISQPLTLADLTTISKFLKSCIREATLETLTNLDLDLLQTCGADILDCVLQQLAR